MNKLTKAHSPYLLQHKDQPVHWMEWGTEAFEKAQKENKMIFLSIGYSTCHWCHVMAHESFDDQEVATALNQVFVSIKWDREERPDVDDYYMMAVQTITGGGGWPMSVWLTADRKPFFAGTYFPKFRFLQLLLRIEQVWKDEKQNLIQDSVRLSEAIESFNKKESISVEQKEYDDYLSQLISYYRSIYDEEDGGFGGAPKFPQTMSLQLLLRLDAHVGLMQADEMIHNTLTKMALGGMRDHLRGGFHRYSVDGKWLVPHFEKMLYDQAWLVQAYSEACFEERSGLYEEVIASSVEYVNRELGHREGGWYCAQDADSLDPDSGHKEEGYFCTYTYAEIVSAFSESEVQWLKQHYGLSEAGDYEGRWIPHRSDDGGMNEFSAEDLRIRASIFSKLEKIRASRPVPHLDDKMLLSWNTWMLSALLKASRAVGRVEWKNQAVQVGEFLWKTFAREGAQSRGGLTIDKVYRCYRGGEVYGAAMSEDVISLAKSCFDIYGSTGEKLWWDRCLSMMKYLEEKFWDVEGGGYFNSAGDDPFMPARMKEDYDGVRPCPNSMAAFMHQRLYWITGDIGHREKRDMILRSYWPRMKNYPSSLPFMNMTLLESRKPFYTVVVASDLSYGEAVRDLLPYRGRRWHDISVVSGKPFADKKVLGGKTTYYVCSEGVCQVPTTDVADVVKLFTS